VHLVNQPGRDLALLDKVGPYPWPARLIRRRRAESRPFLSLDDLLSLPLGLARPVPCRGADGRLGPVRVPEVGHGRAVVVPGGVHHEVDGPTPALLPIMVVEPLAGDANVLAVEPPLGVVVAVHLPAQALDHAFQRDGPDLRRQRLVVLSQRSMVAL
jgi:hypothetical protein